MTLALPPLPSLSCMSIRYTVTSVCRARDRMPAPGEVAGQRSRFVRCALRFYHCPGSYARNLPIRLAPLAAVSSPACGRNMEAA